MTPPSIGTPPDFEALFQALPGPYLILLPNDPVFTIVAVNNSYARATLTAPACIIGRGLFEIFPDNPAESQPTGVRNLHASLRRVLASKAPDAMPVQKYDIRRPLPDGAPPDERGWEERYWSPLNTPVLDAAGNITYILHRAEDVTGFVRYKERAAVEGHELRLRADRMEAELFLRSHELAQARQLSRERQLLSLFAEHSPEFIAIADLDGVVEYLNPAAMALVGEYDPGAIGRRNANDYVLPEQRKFILDVFLPTVREHGRWRGEFNLQHLTTGEVIPVYCDAFRVDDPATGRPTHIATVTRDLRERKAAERRNAFLVELDDAIRPLTEPIHIMRTAASLLGSHLNVNSCFYAALAPDDDSFHIAGDYHVGVSPPLDRHHLNLFGPENRTRLQEGHAIVVRDAEDHNLSRSALSFFRAAGIRAFVLAPIVASRRLAAIMAVHQAGSREWRGEEVELVQLTAGRCWDAVERVRVTCEMQADRERQSLMLELLENQRSMSDPKGMMLATAKGVGEHLKVDRTGFFEMEGDALRFDIGWTAGRLPLLSGSLPAIAIGSRYLDEVRAGRVLAIADVTSDPLTTDSRFPEIGVTSLIGVPIIRNGHWHAGFYINHAEPRNFTPEEIALAQAAGEQTWDAVERARAGFALRSSEERLSFALEAGGGVGTWDWDSATGLFSCDPRFTSLLALGPEHTHADSTLHSFLSRVHPSDRARVQTGFLNPPGEETDYIDEYRVLLPDGEVRWIYTRGRRHQDPFSRPARFAGVAFDVSERKQAEAVVRQQWHTFDTALSNTPDATYVFDLAGRFVYLNRSLLKRLNRSFDDAVGKDLFELGYPPALAARISAQIQEVISTRQPVRDQTPLSSPTGDVRHYEYILVPVLGAGGLVEAVTGATRDVTERSRAEEVIQADRRRWQELFLQTPAAIALLRGPEHRYAWTNPGYSELVGRRAEELLGETVPEVFPSLASQGFLEKLDSVYRTGHPFTAHEALFHMNRPDGSLVDVYLNFVYLATRDLSGHIDGIFVHATDVTAGVLARRHIEESERQFRTLADSIPHLAWMADADGRVFWFNRRWYEYTGTTADDIESFDWRTVHHPDLIDAIIERRKVSLESGEPFEMVFPLKGADGEFRPFLTRIEPLRDSSGRVVRWFGTNTDIAEQQRTEAELRRINRELEEFAYVASHDLQEPLRMVNSFTQLLLRRHVDHANAEAQEFAGFIHQAVHRMEQLITGLLSYSRALHRGDLLPPPVNHVADLNISFSEARTILGSRVADSQAHIIATPLPVVRGDTSQLGHVFQNLLSNALKYRKPNEPPVVTVDSEFVEGMWVIRVRDNGIGFEQKYAEGIFGLFKRLYRDEYPGTGLGLAICQRVVERYGGRIWAESQPGVGSTFFMALNPPESEEQQ